MHKIDNFFNEKLGIFEGGDPGPPSSSPTLLRLHPNY